MVSGPDGSGQSSAFEVGDERGTIAVVRGTSTGARQKRPASVRPRGKTAIIATGNNGDPIFKFGDAFFVTAITSVHSCSSMRFKLSAASSSPMGVHAGILEINPGIDVLPQPLLRPRAVCFRVDRVTKVRRSYDFRLVDQQ
jgi:hypothetical protein